ncbi:MAG: hypothetical protein RIS45_1909 [Planctomycetota bacterium]|jgi:hypothetical protein
METTHVIVLVLVIAVAGGAVWLATRPTSPVFDTAPVQDGAVSGQGGGYEAAAVIGSVGSAIGSILGGVGSLYGAGQAASATGGSRSK